VGLRRTDFDNLDSDHCTCPKTRAWKDSANGMRLGLDLGSR